MVRTVATPEMRRKANLCLALVGSAVLLAACGGGDDQPAAAGGGGSVNQAPTISGSPPASAMQDSQYAFTPAVSDPDGDTLTFTIVGKPDWATFNSATGALMGTPAPEDLGIYPNIVISVSDGQASSTLSAFSLEVVATSTGSATLSWTAPTENADGSPLTDLAGYKIYWGTSPGNYTESATINNPGITTFMVEQLTPRIWYFAATAFNSLDEESQYSNPVAKTVQ